jgi:hypothetical protein
MPQTINGSKFPAIGDEVVFLAANGHDYQLEAAKKVFVKDQILTVKDILIGDWYSSIEFLERPGQTFNSVMFELLGDDVQPEEQPEELVTLQVTEAQRDTILAALRLWKNDLVGESPDNAMLDDIATNGGQHEKLDDEAVDVLCEAINV